MQNERDAERIRNELVSLRVRTEWLHQELNDFDNAGNDPAARERWVALASAFYDWLDLLRRWASDWKRRLKRTGNNVDDRPFEERWLLTYEESLRYAPTLAGLRAVLEYELGQTGMGRQKKGIADVLLGALWKKRSDLLSPEVIASGIAAETFRSPRGEPALTPEPALAPEDPVFKREFNAAFTPAPEPTADKPAADEERDGGGTGALNWDPDDDRRRHAFGAAVGERSADPSLGAEELLAIEKLVEHLREVEVEGETSKDGILLGLASALGGKGGANRDLVFARRAYEMGKRAGAMQLSAKAAAFAFGGAPPFIVAAAEEERRAKVEELIAFALFEMPFDPEELRRIIADIEAAGGKADPKTAIDRAMAAKASRVRPRDSSLVRRSQILKELRERRGLGVRQLAEIAGTSHTAILRYESGERDWTVETLIAIAAALATTTDILLGFPGARPELFSAEADDTAETLAGIIAAIHEAFDLSAIPELEADADEVARAYAEPLELSPDQVKTIERRIAAVRHDQTITIPIEDVFDRAHASLRAAKAEREEREDPKALDEAADEIDLLTKALIEVTLAPNHDAAVDIAREAIHGFEGR